MVFARMEIVIVSLATKVLSVSNKCHVWPTALDMVCVRMVNVIVHLVSLEHHVINVLLAQANVVVMVLVRTASAIVIQVSRERIVQLRWNALMIVVDMVNACLDNVSVILVMVVVIVQPC